MQNTASLSSVSKLFLQRMEVKATGISAGVAFLISVGAGGAAPICLLISAGCSLSFEI